VSELVARADEAAQKAYAPYSNYRVGAAVRTTTGEEFVGVNVENGAYPLGVCAEQVALAAAATAGFRPGDIAAVGITASPCGSCRQWLHEWRVPEVSFRRSDGSIATSTAADLLPDTWELPAGVGSTEPAKSVGAGSAGAEAGPQ
jgi:cytidine deaminase